MNKQMRGFTIIELMIAVAIVAILGAVAIPAYQGFIEESRISVMRANLNSLRIALEDFRLENGDYGAGNFTIVPNDPANIGIVNTYGWLPDGQTNADGSVPGKYQYTVVAVQGANPTYTMTAQYYIGGAPDPDFWAMCDNTLDCCCSDIVTGGLPAACP